MLLDLSFDPSDSRRERSFQVRRFHPPTAPLAKNAGAETRISRDREMGFLFGTKQHLNSLGDSQRVPARKAAPLSRFLVFVAVVQTEADDFILTDGVRDAGKLSDRVPPQGSGSIESGIEGFHLLRCDRPHVLGGEVQALSIEVKTQPFTFGPIDVDIVPQ